MSFVKHALTSLVIAAASFAAQAQTVLKVGASPVPHAEILEFVKPALKAQGVDLQVTVFTDYVQPNLAVQDKQLDANYFQHRPYLTTFNKERKTNLVEVPNSGVHIEPFGGYSRKIKNLSELKQGATVALPNDTTNGGRALALLQKQGLIKLKDPTNILATERDIVDNPKKLVFRPLEAAQLPRTLDDVDLSLINANYALEAKLVPTRDALFLDGSDSPYANFIAARPDNVNSPEIRKLVAALHTPAVKKFILEKYKGAIIPAF
ncbi:MetQ/NlpA family ABC transporter substrate-binding protein [Xylophilus sp.]|uniref:MetQ/NlpA family ABC transporter substrate-binding protein n=1 Tax=Xylophilus sp. TaxID=2653893 RepID=UPI0013B6C4F2|nr:MetQ/NlpA family ABC transporter substrate-binding protein [Xylophilus sp.]KAF1043946.1 MAG: putative D-methionine-binding lipoprotein MetQ [Xylophilus sp.]